MKIQNFWVVFGTILVFVALILCVPQESASQTKEEILNLIPPEWKAKDLKAMESLANQIIQDNKNLSGFFEKGDKTAIKAMTAQYARMNGTIVDEEYNVISPKDAKKFNRFWKKARAKGAKVEFKTVSIYLTDKLGPQFRVVIEKGKPPAKVKFNYVAFVTHEFNYGPKGAGGSTYDPSDSRTYCHQEECTWRDGGRQ